MRGRRRITLRGGIAVAGPRTAGTNDRKFSVSDNGVLVFDPTPNRQRQQATLVDRSGKTIGSCKEFVLSANLGT